MNSYQPTEDLQKIQAAAAYISYRINELEDQLIMYDPTQNANARLDAFREDVKTKLQFLPVVRGCMNSLHTDFISYTRDDVLAIMRDMKKELVEVLSNLTDVPPPKPKRIRHYKSKQHYEIAKAEISAYAAQVLRPMTPREKWSLIQGRMKKKARKERTVAVAVA